MADREDKQACPANVVMMEQAQRLLDEMPPGWSFTFVVYPLGCHAHETPHVHYVYTHPSDGASDSQKQFARADALVALAHMQRRLSA